MSNFALYTLVLFCINGGTYGLMVSDGRQFGSEGADLGSGILRPFKGMNAYIM